MNLGDYPTPGDVKLYVDDLWVDDVYRVDYEEQNKKVPLWGYHQKHYADVADGKVIIVGNIIIHYRFPGYLNHALQRVLVARERAQLNDTRVLGSVQPAPGGLGGDSSIPPIYVGSRLGGALPSIGSFIDEVRRSKKPEDLVRMLAEASMQGTFEPASLVLQEMLGSNSQFFGDRNMIGGAMEDAQRHSAVTSAPQDFVGGWKGFDLRLDYGYIGTRTQGVFVSEVLKGVHLTGRRKVVNASTSGGDLSASGQSLLEVYPFFCREVVSSVRKESQTSQEPLE